MSSLKKAGLVFSMVRKVSPAYLFLLITNSLVNSGHIISNVVLPKFLIDELISGKNTGKLIIWISAITLSNLIFTFLKKTLKRSLDIAETRVVWGIERLFAEKIMSVEYSNLEDGEFLDLKERASFAMRNQGVVNSLINGAVSVLNEIFTAVGLIAVMLTLSWVLVVLLAATVTLSVVIQAGFSKYQRKFFSEILPVNRRYGYYLQLAYDKLMQKEIRLYSMQEMIGDTVTAYNKEINRWFGQFYRRMGLTMGLFQAVTVLQTMLAYGFVGARTLGGRIGIGDLTMYISSAVSFSSSVLSMGMSLITVYQMLSYLTPLAALMSVPDENQFSGTAKLSTVRSIEFKNVSFSYPKTDKKVLDGVSFSINEGEKISVVGLNGAGKTTVVKLLCRLYRPDSGTICINGTDIYEYDRVSYQNAIAAVFQDYRLFNFTIRENVSCRCRLADENSGEEFGDKKVAELLAKVGMSEKVNALKNKADTLFGKEYDSEGVEFSGGQAQKIAIARALYKDASLVILDEPTSALDPLAEAEIYENFNSLAGDKTALYISHRMSSSVFCDRVLVISDGKIEAFGTHRELMTDENGTYHKLFTTQAQNYKYA